MIQSGAVETAIAAGAGAAERTSAGAVPQRTGAVRDAGGGVSDGFRRRRIGVGEIAGITDVATAWKRKLREMQG